MRCAVLVTHHPLFALPVGETGEREASRRTPASWRWTPSPMPASTCCLPAIITRASTHSARDLVTRAGPALVVQAGTATSTRLRDEEQSFNRIDIAGERVTLTLQTLDGRRSSSPATAQRYELAKATTGASPGRREASLDEPAH